MRLTAWRVGDVNGLFQRVRAVSVRSVSLGAFQARSRQKSRRDASLAPRNGLAPRKAPRVMVGRVAAHQLA